MNHTLESYKIFPVIAWILVIGFALFTYSLVMRFEKELTDINSGIDRLELKIDTIDAGNSVKTAQ